MSLNSSVVTVTETGDLWFGLLLVAFLQQGDLWFGSLYQQVQLFPRFFIFSRRGRPVKCASFRSLAVYLTRKPVVRGFYTWYYVYSFYTYAAYGRGINLAPKNFAFQTVNSLVALFLYGGFEKIDHENDRDFGSMDFNQY